MAGADSVKLLTGGKKMDRKQLKQTIKAQLQHTTESTASAGVFVDKHEKKRTKVKIDKNKHVTQHAPGTAAEKQARILDRVLEKTAAPRVELDRAVARHQRAQKEMSQTKRFGAAKGKKRRK